MSSDDFIIKVNGLGKCYEVYLSPRDRLKQLIATLIAKVADQIGRFIPIQFKSLGALKYFREFWALRDISFGVIAGETIGVIGKNGSGKSTLLQILAGTLSPTLGDVAMKGRVAALLELGSGFNPEFTGRENIYLNGKILGLTHRQIKDKFQEIVDFAEIGEFIDRPIKTYSSGMFVRLAFAVQAHIDASIIIIDEALAVGDIFFRQKCYARLENLKKSGVVIILVTHSMGDIEQYCDRAILLNKGEQVFLGSASEAVKRYYLLNQDQSAFAGQLDCDSNASNINLKGSEISKIRLPPKEAFIDIDQISQVTIGSSRCISLAICDEFYRPALHFRQGDIALFFFQFEVLDLIEVPVCGLTISNERGVLVFGKNGWQYDRDAPLSVPLGSVVSCCQSVKLDLAPGEYVAEVGLVSAIRDNWLNKKFISHHKSESTMRRICALSKGVVFSVGLAEIDGVNYLTHHGIANLKSDIQVSI